MDILDMMQDMQDSVMGPLPEDLLDKVMNRKDYSSPSRRKRLVEDTFRKARNGFRSIGRIDAWQNENLRKKVVLQVLDKAAAFGKENGCLSPEESFVSFEAMAYMNYDMLEDSEYITLGASLWILEELRRTQRLGEAFDFLPGSMMDIWDIWLPTDFYHPCYDQDLIRSVAHTISEKNSRREGADQFKGLISLLDEEKVKTAVDHFHALQWKAIESYMKAEGYFDSRDTEILTELKQLNVHSILTVDVSSRESRKRELMADYLDLQDTRKHLHVIFERLFASGEKKICGARKLGKAMEARVEDPYEICFAVIYLLGTEDESIWLIRSGTTALQAAARLLPWYEGALDKDDDEIDGDFPDDEWDMDEMTYNENGWLDREPAEEKTDYYHPDKPGEQNLAQKIYRLSRGIVPAGLHPFSQEREDMRENGEKDADLISDWAEILFLSSFQASASNLRRDLWSWDPTEDMELEEENLDTDSLDENTEEITSTDTSVDDSLAHLKRGQTETTNGKSNKMAYATDTFATDSTGRHPDRRNPAAKKADTNNTSNDTIDEQDLSARLLKAQNELEKARRQVKGLRSSLAELRHEADTERAKTEHELKTLRMEHRELADLRELVFNRENNIQEKAVKEISYPYETRKRTVIFGGHDTFLKAIRPMLPNVRFVDTSVYNFSPEIVKNADVVWIQNNCISHPQYWNIVKVARHHSIQVRYFAYASAEKCAEQLVTEDQKD